MKKIKVYVASNNVLTLATNEVKDRVIKDTTNPNGYRIEKENKPTRLVGYMEAVKEDEA